MRFNSAPSANYTFLGLGKTISKYSVTRYSDIVPDNDNDQTRHDCVWIMMAIMMMTMMMMPESQFSGVYSRVK